MKRRVALGLILCLLSLLIFMAIDSKPITTNVEVDCIDAKNNFISNHTCYKRAFCGEKVKLLDSKYCANEYRNSEEGEWE